MNILGQTSIQLILFFILYGITGVVPLIAALYLLLRRGNAFAPDVTPPMRLRRWTAAFFAFASLTHVWWLQFYIFSGNLYSVGYLIIVMLDCIVLFTTFSGMLLAMLQDRRRPVWPAMVGLIPFVALGVMFMVRPNDLLIDIAGETRAVESLGAAAATTVARAYQVFGSIDEVRGNGASQPCQQIGPHHRTHRRNNRCQLLLYIYRTDNGIGFREFYAMANGVIGK